MVGVCLTKCSAWMTDESTPLIEPDNKADHAYKEGARLWSHPFEWACQLRDSYSFELLFVVFCTNHLLKGVAAGGGDGGFVGQPIRFLLEDLGMSADEVQLYTAIAISPWALKPVIGYISDTVPLFGYKRRTYVMATTVIATACCVILAIYAERMSANAMISCLFFIFLQISTADLLVEAKQSEEVKKKSTLGSDFFTFTWLGINVGQIVGIASVGHVIQYWGPRYCYGFVLPIVAVQFWPMWSNHLREQPISHADRQLSLQRVRRSPELLVILAIYTVLRYEIANPMIFFFILTVVSINIDGGQFYFFTDSAREYADGPHFSPWFYTAGIGLASFTGIFVGFATGVDLFKSWTYRSIYMLTIVLRVFTQLLMVPLFMRWNLSIGVSDKIWVVVASFVDMVVFAWRWVPKQVMSAHLTPTGLEATVLACSAGSANLGILLATYLGAFSLHVYGVLPNGDANEGHKFENLWQAQVFASLAPAICLPLIFVLIPANNQREALITDDKQSSNRGSWWSYLSNA
eukprot:GEMP01035284.1.p1 GENE.GEMP01035284.1~~GEMP01035284.1.p1  ORF type:complete len:520 (+),score=78.03 GEMP01035284.1:38-1597(+)